MQPFRATYTPLKYNEGGECEGDDQDKVEVIIVIHIIGYDPKTNADVVFIHTDGRLDADSLGRFTECIVPW